LRPLRSSDPATTEVIKISDRTTSVPPAAGGANVAIVRDFHDPRRVQSTPSVKTT